MEHDEGGMHPIGMVYGDMVKQNPKAMLAPVDSIDKRIRFFEGGKMGCGSCHDPYSTIPKKLVIEDTQSRLCFACHLMKGKKAQ
jgi:predicted CXXCH cytochrome family protein